MVNFTFDKDKHEYRVDNVVIPSVTQILKAEGLINFSLVNPAILERNSEFGNSVHSMIEFFCKGTLDEKSLDPALKPYLQSWNNFVEDYGYTWHQIEYRGYSKTYRYAFTMDQLGEISKTNNPGHCLLDYKTGKPTHSHKIQMGGYKLADGKKYNNIIILYLNPETKPRGYKVDFAINNKKEQGLFLAALSLYNYKKEKGII
jgi:hypothetical protein